MNNDYHVETIYWPNGNIKKATTFYKGKRQGTEKYYNKKGVLLSTTDYSDDLIDGYIKTYFESGLVESKQLFKKGIDMNLITIYNQNGFIVYSSDESYSNDNSCCLFDDYYCLHKHI